MGFLDYLKQFLSKNKEKYPTQLIADDLHKVKGETDELQVCLLDHNNEPMKNTTVHMELAGRKTYDEVTDEKGIASLTINLNVGCHVFNCTYDGDNTHQSSFKSVKVYINPKLQVEDTTLTEKSGLKLKANLSDTHGNPIESVKVEFKFHFADGDKSYYSTSGITGIVYMPINLMKGVYNVTVISGETSKDIKLTCTEKPKKQTYLSGTDVIIAEGTSKSYAYKLYTKNSAGKVVNVINKALILNVDGKNYTVTTNKDGNGAFNLKNLKKGKYRLTLTFKGDGDYIRSSRTNTITIKTKSSTYNPVIWQRQPDDHTCGPTSLAMCSQILGAEKTINQFAEACDTDVNGTSPADMFSGAKKLGFGLKYINKNFKSVTEAIESKKPVIYYHYTGGLSCLNWINGYWHYAVIYEWGDKPNRFYCADPSKGTAQCSPSAITEASVSFFSVEKIT